MYDANVIRCLGRISEIVETMSAIERQFYLRNTLREHLPLEIFAVIAAIVASPKTAPPTLRDFCVPPRPTDHRS